jgi:hypothetical protein
MKTAEYIAFTIDRLPKGYVFTYADFTTEVNQKEAVIKALNRMVLRARLPNYPKANTTNPKIRPLATFNPIRHK